MLGGVINSVAAPAGGHTRAGEAVSVLVTRQSAHRTSYERAPGLVVRNSQAYGATLIWKSESTAAVVDAAISTAFTWWNNCQVNAGLVA